MCKPHVEMLLSTLLEIHPGVGWLNRVVVQFLLLLRTAILFLFSFYCLHISHEGHQVPGFRFWRQLRMGRRVGL